MSRPNSETRTLLPRTCRSRSTRHSRPDVPTCWFEELERRILLSTLDLTAAGSYGSLNNAVFSTTQPKGTGSGNVDAFLRIHNTGTERGYNTDGVLEFDTAKSNSIQLSEVPQVKIEGTLYREFFLDINESSVLLSVDAIQVFVAATGNLTGYPTFGGSATKIWDLDVGADGDSWIKLDASTSSGGGGQGDMLAYIPDSLFGADETQYVYLYCEMGNEFPTDDGFEEWYVGQAEPVSAIGEIHGYKFDDLNGNGVDDSEPRLSGWTIFLDTNGNDVPDVGEIVTTTDINGEYSFENLVAGLGTQSTYRVREVQQAGWTQTTTNPIDIVLANDGDVYVAYSGQVVLETGQTEFVQADLAFGNSSGGSISGQKFNDLDGDGVKDAGEPGLSGWTIELDGGAQSTVTDGSGNYSFTNLTPGTYTITEVLQAGWTQTTTSPAAITVTSGSDVTGVDFGNFQNVSISGQKFNDLDGDGVKDAGEPGLSGWTIELDGGAQSTVTDGSGNYSFTNLTPGTYTITEVPQIGWLQTTPGPAPITVVSGEDVAGVNIGNTQFGQEEEFLTIVGQKFEERDDCQVGLADWTIFLDENANDMLDQGEISTTTDSAGNYRFEVEAGTYTVREVLQSGWVQTTENPNPVTGAEGETIEGGDFGNSRLAIGGTARPFAFWASKGGKKLFKRALKKASIEYFRSLNLRNADGTDFDPKSKGKLRKWLRDATSTNMSYMLSAQVVVMALNIQSGLISDGQADVVVTDPDGSTRTEPVVSLISEANAALAGPPEPLVVLSGSPLRAQFESLNSALADANSNLNWLAF